MTIHFSTPAQIYLRDGGTNRRTWAES